MTGEAKVIVSVRGVQFGGCWIPHEKILGMSAREINSSQSLVVREYLKWLGSALVVVESPPPEDASEAPSQSIG